MTEAKHTPGPWERVDTADYAEIHRSGERGLTAIALVAQPDDADLISAAPDMFEAIRGFLPSKISSGNRSVPDDIVIPLDVTVGELRRLEAAIAKATGSQA